MSPNSAASSFQGVSKIAAHGKKLVSGLYWQSLRRPRSYMAEARAIGKREDMDIVAIRQGAQILQAGFVSKAAGVGKGWYSFAAVAADYFSNDKNVGPEAAREPFIAAFAVGENEYAMVAVKDGAILPGSDLVGTLSDVRALVQKFFQRIGKDTTVTYLPDEIQWGQSSIKPTLEELIRSIKRSHALRPLSFGGLTRKEMTAIAATLLFLLITIVAAIQWHARQEREAQEAARRARERAAEIARQSGKQTPVQALIHPWTALPTVQVLLDTCRQSIYAAPLNVAGWDFSAAQCTSKGSAFAYGRTPGRTINEMQAEAPRFWQSPGIGFGKKGDEANISTSLSLPAGGDDTLSPIGQAADKLTSHFQFLQIPIALEEKRPTPSPTPLPGAAKQAPPPPPDWRTIEFSFTSNLPPFSLFKGLELDGLRVLELSTKRQGTNLVWSIKGELYGR
jgi:hypothetical protein